MVARTLLFTALLVVPLAYFLSHLTSTEHAPYVQGRNKTVLFLTNSEHGLSNVHLATASAILENYPDIKVHFASFPAIEQKLGRVSSFAKIKSPQASPIAFHGLTGPTFVQAIAREGRSFMSPPGWRGIATLAEHIQLWMSPWAFADHVHLYNELSKIIDEVDPAVVVLDSWFRPAIDATRKRNRQHAFITPNTLVVHFLGIQPLWTRLWKYPAPSSGFPFPVPWLKLPENVYMNIRYIYSAMFTPDASEKKDRLLRIGLGEPMNLFGIHRPGVPWITQNTQGAMIPVEVLPPNVTCAGPIILSGPPANHQDPETATWLKKAPTVLINLGSNLAYDESRAEVMAIAIAALLSTTDYQVLWKFNKLGDFSADCLVNLKPYLDNERLKMPSWLVADPASLLDTGNFVTSVHHGGSNCYHEALSAGVTQVILPLWADLYNYAALAETRGIGVWGCKESTPKWTGECLLDAFMKGIDGRAFFAIVASALPDPKGHEFRAAGPYDSRSPCPGLNALANHGYLPRDGSNINYDMINHAAQAAYNFEDGFYIDAVNMVFQLNISTSNRPSETFHLRDLAQHDQIEVDGSLTRNDIFFGDDLHFDATVFDPVARDLGLNQISRKDKFVTIDTAAQATKHRLDLAKRVNPEFNASVHQHETEYGTTALYLLTMWDEQQKAAPKHWVKALLGEDRIAYREGYNKGKTVKTNKQVGAMTQAVRAVVGWKP
ncbi:2-hydroxyacylsphingosine 1-beta-galactosyltransferase [Fusarium pseudocircinatum]|uniref:2-hydroxyacylsphingosine 1-beta-galactosyltransferase n=1 Tax=Fusarium pseudocircinatum TaxID=56676 RepID=A0A8H5URL4_9HYPO|nr:2-hydroxyacylsphingosine 1-beta-galactosyltransferase [Fusarium pseudocircinatum]